jgi:hypothetical protein
LIDRLTEQKSAYNISCNIFHRLTTERIFNIIYDEKEWFAMDGKMPHLFQPVIAGTFGYESQYKGVFVEIEGKYFIATMDVLDFANKKVVVEFIPIEKFSHWKIDASADKDYPKLIALSISIIDLAAKLPINCDI